jgi:hypothetical protein
LQGLGEIRPERPGHFFLSLLLFLGDCLNRVERQLTARGAGHNDFPASRRIWGCASFIGLA